jgi:hypothetical protein
MAVSERWNALIGPFYTLIDLEWWLGMSEQRLDERVAAGDFLAVRSRSGDPYFPVWQFHPDGRVIPGLRPVWEALGGRTEVERAKWLRRDRPELGGSSAAEALVDADPAKMRAIVALAKGDEVTWAY